MTRDLRISKDAFRHIDAADSWWRENRPANPSLFERELKSALLAIQEAPTVFRVLDEPRFPGLRRLLLSRCRYHVYWTTTDDAIEVIAVWHTSRGSPLEGG